MNRIKSKSGFTIVELAIVIVVIAILAAVLIPTFSNLVESANLSVDHQAVRQMNGILAAMIGNRQAGDVSVALANLAANGIQPRDYQPLTADTYFYWVKGLNCIVHADKDGNILYPDDVTQTTGWYALNGEIAPDDSYVCEIEGDKVTATLTSGNQLVHLMSNYDGTKEYEITVDGTVDLMGAYSGFAQVNRDITITGINGARIVGLRTGSGCDHFDPLAGQGLFGYIAPGVSVTVSGLTVSDALIGCPHTEKSKHLGILAGCVEGNLTVTDVTVERGSVGGRQKVGSLVGYIYDGSVSLSNVTVTDTEAVGAVQVARVVGAIEPEGSFSFAACDFAGAKASPMKNLVLTDGSDGFTVTQNGQPYTLDGRENSTYLCTDGTHLSGAVTKEYYWYHVTSDENNLTVTDGPGGASKGAKWIHAASGNFRNGAAIEG